MRIAGIVVGIILILMGGIWIAQGSNIWPSTVMSGQGQWLYTGIAVLVVGIGVLWWTLRRRA